MADLDKRTVEASAGVLAAWKPGGAWDLGAEVRAAAAEARAREIPNLLVVLSAKNCHGCEILDRQLEKHAGALAGKVAILKALGGDFSTGINYTSLTVGGATFVTPGVPFTTLWAVERDGLRYRALGLGPFEGDVPAALEAFLGGVSQFVREAAGVPIDLTRDGERRTLTSADRFAADLVVRP